METMRTLLFVVVACLLLATDARGQAIYVGAGPAFYAQSNGQPRTAGNLTWGICTVNTATCSLTSVEARGSARNLNSLVYAVHTGIRQRVASATSSNVGRFDLFTLGVAGAAVSGAATGGLAGLGGGVTWHPTHAPNWSLSVALRGVYSPINPGWAPWGSLHIGYTFRTN